MPIISAFLENFDERIEATVPDVPGAKQPVIKNFTTLNDTLNG
jgi:hypothetical protein